MKRLAIIVALMAIVAVGVDEFGDLTQSRPDRVHEGPEPVARDATASGSNLLSDPTTRSSWLAAWKTSPSTGCSPTSSRCAHTMSAPSLALDSTSVTTSPETGFSSGLWG